MRHAEEDEHLSYERHERWHADIGGVEQQKPRGKERHDLGEPTQILEIASSASSVELAYQNEECSRHEAMRKLEQGTAQNANPSVAEHAQA